MLYYFLNQIGRQSTIYLTCCFIVIEPQNTGLTKCNDDVDSINKKILARKKATMTIVLLAIISIDDANLTALKTDIEKSQSKTTGAPMLSGKE